MQKQITPAALALSALLLTACAAAPVESVATVETAPEPAPQVLTAYAADGLVPALQAYADAQGVALNWTDDASTASLLALDHQPDGATLDVTSDPLLAAAAARANITGSAASLPAGRSLYGYWVSGSLLNSLLGDGAAEALQNASWDEWSDFVETLQDWLAEPKAATVTLNGADRTLPEDYTCFALQLDNLTEMSRRFGYHVGDGILKDFSGLLQLMGDTDGTVGYNGAGKFLAFFDECSTRKAEVMIRILQSQVDEYNKLNPEYPILFTAAWATTSEEELYHVRDLVRCAQKKMSLIAEEGGAVLAGMERGEA